MFNKITVIGCGLIGSSILRILEKKNITKEINAYDKSKEVSSYLSKIFKFKICNNITEAVHNADLVIISSPLSSYKEILSQIKSSLKNGTILTDTGSAKKEINKIIKQSSLSNVSWIASHPIAGTEYSGPEAGFAELFENRWCILSADKNIDKKEIEKLKKFWTDLGSKIKVMSFEHHDYVLSLTSHLPHAVAYSIVKTAISDDDKFKDEYTYFLISETDNHILQKTKLKGKGSLPWLTTRWSKSGMEVWGRGPVLQAMPAIKTLNLTVQLILENAEMAIGGAYVYDDDGVFNPDNITIQPGTFIPRSPGSSLESLQSPARFDVGQLILEDMRRNVRKAMYIDELDSRANAKTPLSATEVSERLADVARDMGAVAGRMQKEFLHPLVERIVHIYSEQGILDIPKVDGREIRIVPVSPLLRAQDQQDVADFVRFQQTIAGTFGPDITPALYNQEKVIQYLASKFGVKEELLASRDEVQGNIDMALQLMQQQRGQ